MLSGTGLFSVGLDSAPSGIWDGPSPGHPGPPASAPLGHGDECPQEWTGLAPGRMKPGKTPAFEGGRGPVHGVPEGKGGPVPTHGSGMALAWAQSYHAESQEAQGAQGGGQASVPQLGLAQRWVGLCAHFPEGSGGASAIPVHTLQPWAASDWRDDPEWLPPLAKSPLLPQATPAHILWQPVQTCPLGDVAPVGPDLSHQW